MLLNHEKALMMSNKVMHISLLGMGETGLSCLRYLENHNHHIVMMDSRTNPENLAKINRNYPMIKTITGYFDENILRHSDLIVVSPGISINTREIDQAKQAGIPIIGDIELFAQRVDKAVIAITGSNGKSTVTALTGELLTAAGYKCCVAGNIGQPVLDTLGEGVDVYVLELSSFQLETTHSLKPNVACILNLSQDHLDRYEGFDDYVAAKQRIYHNAQRLVFNRYDKKSYPRSDRLNESVSFGLDEATDEEQFGLKQINGQLWLCEGKNKLCRSDETPLLGEHNQANILASLAIVSQFGVDVNEALKGLKKFSGLEHRFERVGDWGEVVWINDSKATNPGATLAALSGSKNIILILGGDDKNADFSVLTHAISKHVKSVILYGVDNNAIEAALPKSIHVETANSMIDVIKYAEKLSDKGDLVLFSPACASFDRYKNYKQRGDDFKDTLKRYFKS